MFLLCFYGFFIIPFLLTLTNYDFKKNSFQITPKGEILRAMRVAATIGQTSPRVPDVAVCLISGACMCMHSLQGAQ